MRSATILFCIVWQSPALCAQMVANCEEPSGNRYDLVSSEIKQQQDGFKGARPIITVPADPDSTVITYSWGPAQWAAEAGMPRTFDKAIIVARTQDKITAVAVFDDPAGVVQMISLFPTKGLVMLSQHKYMQVGRAERRHLLREMQVLLSLRLLPNKAHAADGASYSRNVGCAQ